MTLQEAYIVGAALWVALCVLSWATLYAVARGIY